jgi:hypothetical protein
MIPAVADELKWINFETFWANLEKLPQFYAETQKIELKWINFETFWSNLEKLPQFYAETHKKLS